MAPEGAAVVLSFIRAFNDQDLQAFEETLHPEVLIHASRRPRRGVADAVAWARRVDSGELEQRVELEHLEVESGRALALIRRQWWWRADEELARDEEMAWLFELRDGLVASWRPFEDREAAEAAFGGGLV